MLSIVAGGIEGKKSHQKAAHRRAIPFEAGFYAVWKKSQLAAALSLGRKRSPIRQGWDRMEIVVGIDVSKDRLDVH
ncbi:hypothetical protein, partial [Mesorhizobium abyssinicae]